MWLQSEIVFVYDLSLVLFGGGGRGKVRYHSVLLKRLYPYSLKIQTKYVLNILCFGAFLCRMTI